MRARRARTARGRWPTQSRAATPSATRTASKATRATLRWLRSAMTRARPTLNAAPFLSSLTGSDGGWTLSS